MIMLRTVFFFLLLPFICQGQQLSGIWTGVLTNDSMATRKDQSFEMALTEYRGNIYGYSYSTFIVDDTLYYIVKRVKGKIENGLCEVSDDEIVSNNFSGRRDKGVKQSFTFRLNPVDSNWYLNGNWKTNATKNYYALTGAMNLKEEKDPSRSKIFEHLGDLNLNYTDQVKDNTSKKKENKVAEKKPDDTNTESLAKTAEKKPDLPSVKPVSESNKSNHPDAGKTETVVKTKPENKKDVKAEKQKDEKAEEVFEFTEITRREMKMKPPAADLSLRLSVPSETIYFKSDSLVLSLYDNGEVDGDTVSVTLNGEVVIANLGLKSSAFKKTVYLTPDDGDDILLILYAENLGIYPPNTGLLIIKDGEDAYYVRFKADFENNAAILLKRKSK